MFDNCFNILLHNKVLKTAFSYSFLNFIVFKCLNSILFHLFSLPQSVFSGFYV